MHKLEKGFTLTELLIVVIVIGILAMVILPKFNKVFMTRQLTEAEHIFSAVRQEQVLRCTEGRWYTANVEDLSALDSIRRVSDMSVRSKYFLYELRKEGGIYAYPLSNSYSSLILEMPSYQDGRICCEGKACAFINKDYPTCTDLVENTPDYRPDPEGCLN